MKKTLAILFSIVMALSFASCGNKTTSSSSKDSGTTSNISTKSDTSVTEQPEESTEPAVTEKAEDITDTANEIYSNKVYYVGEDMPENGYIVTCTNTDYSMDVIIFESKESYNNFQDAKKFSNGEFNAAVEQHAWANFNLKKDEKAYIGLQKGNVILLDDGACQFTKYNPTTTNTIYSGIYVIGKDFDENKINIKCSTDYLKIVTFESKDTYLKYHKSNRFTNGEEAEALNANATTNDFIYKDDSTFVNLEDGMILMVEKGTGEYTLDSGPIIN